MGNIITKFDGTSVSGISALKDLLQYYEAGETVDVTLRVADGGSYQEKTVSITLDGAQASAEEESESDQQRQDSQRGYRQDEDPFSGLEEFFY